MRLISQEMKKIWNPIIVGILLLFGIIYYFLFSSYYIRYYDSGAADLVGDLFQEYGNTLEYDEYLEINDLLTEEEARFTEMVQSIPIAAENNISSYAQFIDFRENYYSNRDGDADLETERVIWTIAANTNLSQIQNIKEILEDYHNKTTRSLQDDYIYSALSPEEEARLNELEQSDIKYGYLATSILDHTTGLTISFMIWVAASVVILLSPTVVRDRLNKVQNLQYSSATGRRILSVQTLAAISSAILLTAGNCMLYGGLLILKGALRFKEFYLLSHEYVPWVNWTYGTYLLVLAAMALGIGITTAILTVFLSRYSQNYIGMLLKAIPLLACLIALFAVLPIITRPFFLFNPMSVQWHRKGIEIILLGSLFLLSAFIMGIALIRQRKQQLE